MSTRGAHSWVRKTPTGLPDCTSSVSSASRRLEGAHDRVERLPAAGGLAGSAVDDEVVGALGDLGVEVVHEHAQRRLGLPALGGEVRAAGGAHGARRSWVHRSCSITPHSDAGRQRMRRRSLRSGIPDAAALAGPHRWTGLLPCDEPRLRAAVEDARTAVGPAAPPRPATGPRRTSADRRTLRLPAEPQPRRLRPSTTPRAAKNGVGSVRCPSSVTSTCRWHPVDAPVEPTTAIGLPAATSRRPARRCRRQDVRVGRLHAVAVIDAHDVAEAAVRPAST